MTPFVFWCWVCWKLRRVGDGGWFRFVGIWNGMWGGMEEYLYMSLGYEGIDRLVQVDVWEMRSYYQSDGGWPVCVDHFTVRR